MKRLIAYVTPRHIMQIVWIIIILVALAAAAGAPAGFSNG